MLALAKESNYLQIEAKTLITMAIISCHKREFDSAKKQHKTAIKICHRIGAKCDLAEAYWQLGLTLVTTQKIEAAEQNFQYSINLFQEIEAPKQIEKVIAFKHLGDFDRYN